MDKSMNKQIRVYLLAGVATAPNFFHRCCETLQALCEQSGWNTQVEVIYPYGDNSRSLFSQVREVGGDLVYRFNGFRIGGKLVADQIRETCNGEPLILIGHSGGGAAAYQAARILVNEKRVSEFKIVQIGSPKVPIHPDYRAHVFYVHAIDQDGRFKDPITRLGSWGGWSRAAYFLPQWNRRKYAPEHIEGINVLGGHADYLRHDAPYIDEEEVSNLDKTLKRIWQWVLDSIPRVMPSTDAHN
ncbi:hypothetical protein EBB07_04340 [Paenibacillaceae bacterium]|nr:hypothetical protein EBB07_04340 [Paenibacillaceae bacterium]